METMRKLRRQMLFYGLLMALCVVLFVNTLGQQPSMREPLGSFAIPRCVAVLIAVLCTALMGQTLQRLKKMRREQTATSVVDLKAPRQRMDLMGKSCFLIAGYAALLTWPIVPSLFTTPVFLFVFILMLSGKTPRIVALAALVALFFGLGLHTLFKTYLFVNLP